jgi:hypothetical protein
LFNIKKHVISTIPFSNYKNYEDPFMTVLPAFFTLILIKYCQNIIPNPVKGQERYKRR